MPKNAPILKEIKSLEQIRGELKVQAHLFKAEVKEEWKKVEQDWKTLKREIHPAKQAARQSKLEIKASTQKLLRTLKSSYERVKKTLP